MNAPDHTRLERPDASGTPVSPAGETPPDQDSEPPRTAVPPDAADESDAVDDGVAPPTSHPASPGAVH